MIEGLEEKYLPGALEALLFVTDEPVSVLALANMLEAAPKDIEEALIELKRSLEESDSGIQLREIAGGWRLYTHPRYHELIERYVISWDTRKLSAAALETLAIIAYMQPCTRTQIASIRGVSSDSSLNSLIEKGLVREAGAADTQGNPTLYATTKAFLERFGLNSTNDLTDIAEFAPDEETRKLIASRLSSATDQVILSDAQADLLAQKIQGVNDAIASTLGVVDKIDFDELEFDISDE